MKKAKVCYHFIFDFAKAVFSIEEHAKLLQEWKNFQNQDGILKDFWDGGSYLNM